MASRQQRSSPRRQGASEALPAPSFDDVLAAMPLSAAEKADLQRQIDINKALAASLRRPPLKKRHEPAARPLTRYWKKLSEARPPGSICRGCRKPLPHSTKDEQYWHFHLMAIRQRAIYQWRNRDQAERRRVVMPGARASAAKKLAIRIEQLRMWLAPQVLHVMGDTELKEIVATYYASPSTRFYEWLRARYPVTEACPRGHNIR